MDCPDRTLLVDFLSHRLTPQQEQELSAHLAMCPECCLALAELMEQPEPTPQHDRSPSLSSAPSWAMLSPPEGITEELIRELLRRKRQEFVGYCLRVVCSCCAAIGLVFLSAPMGESLELLHRQRAQSEPPRTVFSLSDHSPSLKEVFSVETKE